MVVIMDIRRLFILLVIGVLAIGCASGQDKLRGRDHSSKVSPSAEWARIDPDTLRVSKVLSGDTLRVNVDGEDVDFAIIGIKAPRVDAGDAVEQCLGKLLTARLRDTEAGGGVRLFFDSSQPHTDNNGRRFAHVRLLATGTQAGSQQLHAGYAERIHRGDYHEQELNYVSAENEAKQSHAGIWDERLCRSSG
jgi:endonuclease YncB( thermonuclease family)